MPERTLDELDSLHQRASAHYLQGKAEDALAAWEQLLKLAPLDERAIEGIRLCRHALKTPGEPDDDMSPLAAAFAELDQKLSLAHEGRGAGPPPESSGPGERGMDLAWSLEDDSVGDAPPSDAAAPTASASQLAMTGWEWDADAAEEPPPRTEIAASPVAVPAPAVEVSAAELERNAALELRRRANELLAHALAAMEAGSPDEALRTLDRVLILDETNDAARSLKEKIAEARGREPQVVAPLDLEQGDSRTLELDRPAAPPEPPAPCEETALPQSEARRDQATVAEEPPSRRVPSLPAAWRVDRRSWPVIAAVIAVGLGAALYYLSGVGAEPSAPVREEARVPRETAGEGAAAAGRAERRGVEAAQAPAAPDPALLFESAETAFAAQDYAAAIVGYNAVLQVDPANAAASTRLKEAGERYREIREIQERWDQARKAFEAGDYREALRLFYRLPQSESPELVARYKVNGWYNLGVQALRSGDCKEALANFEDARAIQQGDEGLAEVLSLARTCARDTESRQRPIPLPLRSLDD